MIYSIQVKRQDTGAPLPGAAVTFTSAAGELVGNLSAGSDGRVTFDDTVNPNFVFDGTIVKACATGYACLSINGANLAQDWYFALVPNDTPNYLPYLVGGAVVGIGMYYLAGRPGRRSGRVGAADGGGSQGPNYAQYVLPVGMVLLGYFVIKQVTNTLGLTETADQKAQREASQNALLTTANQIYATQSPTMSDAEIAALADRIFADLRSPMPLFNNNDPDDVVFALGTVKNTADVLKLITLFGSRSQTLFGIPGPAMTLPQFVRTASHGPDQGQIDSLNAGYAAMGIQWQW
jgi:hypothetical protein